MFVCGRVHPWPLPPRTLWALDTVGRLDEQQYFTSLNLGYQNIPPEQSGSWDSLFFPISKWWSFTNLKQSKYHDRSLRTRTVACHLSLNCEQIYTDHSWTIEDEDPHLDTTWLVVPWNAGNKYSCAQWVQYMKKTDLGNITNYHMVQPSTSSQKISHCSVISLYLMNVYYTVHIYIYILQIQSKTTRKTISQPLLATPIFLPLFRLEVHWCSRSKEYPYIWALGP